MLRKGFTLIELLIVITIIAILAGAAIPYVQDYVEDARISRAKADLNEIRNALVRFELDRGVPYTATGTADLVGPYLDKAPIDPWGVPYAVSATNSVVFSKGPNRTTDVDDFTGGGSGDDVPRDFRSPLALSKAYWVDTDKDGTVNDGDKIKIFFTRGADSSIINTPMDETDWNFTIDGTDGTFAGVDTTGLATDTSTATNKQAELTLTDSSGHAAGGVFIPGRDTINYLGGTNTLNDVAGDYGPYECRNNKVLIQSF